MGYIAFEVSPIPILGPMVTSPSTAASIHHH
jgi:hypothetical protein